MASASFGGGGHCRFLFLVYIEIFVVFLPSRVSCQLVNAGVETRASFPSYSLLDQKHFQWAVLREYIDFFLY